MGSTGKWTLSSTGDGAFSASVFYMGESSITSDAIAHEFGHNLGLSHAASLSSIPGSLLDPSNSCSWTDAGDTGDVMGSITGFQHFSSIAKSLFSWFDPSQVSDVTTTGDYTLDQLELPSSGVKALRIPVGKDQSGADTYYWVEYRTPGTFDQEQGVQVRYQSAATFNGTSIISSTLRFGPTASSAVTGSGSISGKVVRASDGSPVQQIWVYLYNSSFGYVQNVAVDSAGHYAFRGLVAGGYYLRADYNSEGLINVYYENSLNSQSATLISLKEGQAITDRNFVLVSGGIITGVITNESSGQPLPNTNVTAYDTSWNWVQATSTGSNGRYTLTGLPAGSFYLEGVNSIGDFGFLKTCYINASTHASATPITLSSGSRLTNVDFSLLQGGSISGRILRESDKTPIQNISVYAYDNAGNYFGQATTGVDGHYAIKSLPPGTYYVTTYNSLGYINKYYRDVANRAAATGIQVAQGSDTGNIDFSLIMGGSISGQILRESDKAPIQNISVYAYDSFGTYVSSGATGADGRYVIRNLSSGTYYVNTYNSQSYVNKYYKDAATRAAATAIQVTQGSETGNIDFSLVLGGSISGQILRESDKAPIQNIYVYAYDSFGSYCGGVGTGADGRYIIKGLSSGTYFVNTGNNQGYINEYYKDAANRAAATAVQVTQGSDTGNIDFALAKAGGATGVSYQQAFDATAMSADVTATAPFVDPYRGVKIELVGSSGSGSAARATVKITLSGLHIDMAHSLNFGQAAIGARQAKEVTVTNGSAAAVTMGSPSIEGRNIDNFLITRDGCSGVDLAPTKSCKVEVSFVPVRISGNTAGEFATMKIPTNDSLHGAASVALWGKTLAADLSISGYAYDLAGNYLSELAAGKNVNYDYYISNAGTVTSSGVITFTTKLPAGLRFLSGPAGWSCSVNGQDVSCARALALAPNSGTSLRLTVAVEADAVPWCITRVTISNPSDANPDNNVKALTHTVTASGSSVFGANLLKGNDAFTGVAFFNAGTATAALSITALDSAGAPVQSGGSTNPAGLVLKPGEQLPRMDIELWGFPATEQSRMNWYRIDSAVEKVFGFAMAFDRAMKVLDGSTFARPTARSVILPDISTEGVTRIHVLNPGTAALNLTISLIDANGNTRAIATPSLGSGASLEKTLQELFGSQTAAVSDYIRMQANDAFTATESMLVPNMWMKVLNAQDSEAGAQVLYASQYAVGAGWNTAISIVNLDSTSSQITARLMDDTGTQIGQPVKIPIKGNGKVLLNSQNLFVNAGADLIQGFVEITSDSARVTGSVAFGDINGTISAALPLQPATNREFVYGHAASNAMWYTGIAMVNPNGSDITATLELHDKTGKLLASKPEIIKAKGRVIRVLTQYFPETAGMDITSGYIRVYSDNVFVGFALFGTTTSVNFGPVLSAIPPHAIR
jgi:uncharacterized repeat protein (TIGR01451 family)